MGDFLDRLRKGEIGTNTDDAFNETMEVFKKNNVIEFGVDDDGCPFKKYENVNDSIKLDRKKNILFIPGFEEGFPIEECKNLPDTKIKYVTLKCEDDGDDKIYTVIIEVEESK